MKNSQDTNVDLWDPTGKFIVIAFQSIIFFGGIFAMYVATVDRQTLHPWICAAWLGGVIYFSVILIVSALLSIYSQLRRMEDHLRKPTIRLPPDDCE